MPEITIELLCVRILSAIIVLVSVSIKLNVSYSPSTLTISITDTQVLLIESKTLSPTFKCPLPPAWFGLCPSIVVHPLSVKNGWLPVGFKTLPFSRCNSQTSSCNLRLIVLTIEVSNWPICFEFRLAWILLVSSQTTLLGWYNSSSFNLKTWISSPKTTSPIGFNVPSAILINCSGRKQLIDMT